MGRLETDKKRKKNVVLKTPKGCFSVYVGPERERFAVRTEWVNHPRFRALLDEAEMEYGFGHKGGPLELPCDVGLFVEVVVEMSQDDVRFQRCFAKGNLGYAKNFSVPVTCKNIRYMMPL